MSLKTKTFKRVGYGREVGQTRVAHSNDDIHFEIGDEDFVRTWAAGIHSLAPI